MIGTRAGASGQSHSMMRTKNIRSVPSRCVNVAGESLAVDRPVRAASQRMKSSTWRR
jgi:hypothetical protein